MVGWKTFGSHHCYSKCSEFAPYFVTAAAMEALNLLSVVAVADADYLLMMALVVTWIEYVALELVAVAASTWRIQVHWIYLNLVFDSVM